MLPDRRADVEGRHHGAQPPRRGDRLQSRHPGTQHQHAGGRQRPRRGHQHRKEPARRHRREQHRLVSGNRGLRGQHVHGLRASDAGQQRQAERSHFAGRERGDGVARGGRLEHRHERRPLAAQPDLRGGWRLHLEDDVALPEQVRGGRHHRGSSRLVRRVAERRGIAGPALHQDRQAGLRQSPGHVRYQRDATLVGHGLFRDPDLHDGSLSGFGAGGERPGKGP